MCDWNWIQFEYEHQFTYRTKKKDTTMKHTDQQSANNKYALTIHRSVSAIIRGAHVRICRITLFGCIWTSNIMLLTLFLWFCVGLRRCHYFMDISTEMKFCAARRKKSNSQNSISTALMNVLVQKMLWHKNLSILAVFLFWMCLKLEERDCHYVTRWVMSSGEW